MKKLVPFIVLGLLVGCGAGKEGEGSSSSSSSSSASSTSSSSSSSSSTSSSSSSSSSTSSSSSSSGDLPGDVAAGRNTLKTSCVACHADAEEDGTFTGIHSFDVNRFTYHTMDKYQGKGYTGSSQSDLASFIGTEMPNCAGTCAQNAAAYLWSLRGQTPQVTVYPCDTSAPVLYGRRDLKLLTSYEYHNSLQALFKRPLPDDFSKPNRASDDMKVARMPNHTLEKITEGRLTAYDSNAEELAKWALETTGALDFECPDKVTCANNFINKFAYPAFRRPLTSAERSEYRDIIGAAQDLKAGLEWAIRSVLMSPQFLYRSELGMLVSEARTRVPEQPGDSDVIQGEPVTTIAMPEISYGSNGLGEYGAYKYVGLTPSYNWTGDDIVVFTVKSGGAGAGRFGLVINNNSFRYEENVDSANATVVTLRVKGVKGTGFYVQTYNQSGNPISVSRLTVGPAALPEVPRETIPKLDVAESSAYVLDAFEYASALSYMFTGSSPDAQLLEAAFNGDLSDKSKVEQHIDRMLDSDLGKAHIGRLAGIWFRTDAVTSANRTGNDAFTQEVKDSMAQEIREIYKYVFYTPNVPFKSIYEGNFTMLDSVLSSFYGIPGGGSRPMEFVRVDTTNSDRGGVLASGAYMASNAAMNRTSPIFRAVHMRQDMLCQAIPLPTNLNDNVAREEAQKRVEDLLNEGQLTTAEFYDIQTTIPGSSCATCHDALINPLFALDDFDHVGLLRKRSGGQVVQKSFTGDTGETGGEVAIRHVNQGGYLYSAHAVGQLGSAEAGQEKKMGGGLYFKGSKDLGQQMVAAGLPGLDACLFEKTARFTLGHYLHPAFEETGLEKPLTAQQKSHMACVNDAMESAYDASNGSARAAMKALGLSDAIRFRK